MLTRDMFVVANLLVKHSQYKTAHILG